ncbi:MAG: PglZ domain-containing protein [Halobacteriovoraceae bacterium]|nr:PglZ domain-containing protein [Halobacteriovoraceae bacterium]
MIKVRIDLSGLYPDSTGLVVDSNETFLAAYQAVINSLIDQNPVEIIIRKKIYKTWLERTLTKIPENKYKLIETTPKTILEEKWSRKIHTDLDAATIRALDLMKYEGPNPGESVEDYILRVKVHPFFSKPAFFLSEFIRFLNQVKPERWKTIKSIPLLKKLLEWKLSKWQKELPKEYGFILKGIEGRLGSLKQELTEFNIFKHYKKIGARKVPNFYLLEELNLDLSSLQFSQEEVREVAREVEYELNSWERPQNSDAFLAFLENISGKLEVEFILFLDIAQGNPLLLDDQILNKAETVFQPIFDLVGNRLSMLRELIPPASPSEPTFDATVDEMLEWAISSYLPFYEWAERNNKLTEFPALVNYGDIFSQWLFHHFDELRTNRGPLLSYFIPNNFKGFASNDKIRLVLVIDNLGWINRKFLIRAFGAQNLSLQSSGTYLAMLPSVTEISKKCLLSGEIAYNDIDERSYSQILEKGGWLNIAGIKFQYVPKMGDLFRMAEIKPGTYFVNYLEIDELLHKSEDKIGFSHRLGIESQINNLVENLISFLKKNGAIEGAEIHIISDHGSTKVDHQNANYLPTDLTKGSGVVQKSERYAMFSDERFSDIPENLREDCFFLDRTDFGLPNHTLCARRTNRFKEGKDQSWVHGGLLPEEVIIPHLVFSKVSLSIEPLQITPLRSTFRYKKEVVEIEVANPNEIAAQDVFVSILNGNFDSNEMPVKIREISPRSKVTVKIEGRFKQASNPEEQKALRFGIKFLAGNQAYTFDSVQVKVEMKSIVEDTSDSVFGDLDF